MKPNMQKLTPKFPEVIDSTMRGDYVDCPKQFEYARLYGLTRESVHLVAGGAFAKGVEVSRRSFYLEGKTETESITDGVLAAWEKYGDFEPEDNYTHKSAIRVAGALNEYFAEYPLATDKIQPYYRADGSPAIEFEFSFPLETKHPETGNPLLYGGRFDMVGQYLNDLWVLDDKTATRLGPSWLKSFTFRGQLLGYTYAAKMFGLPVNGFIVRGISFLKDYYGHSEVFEIVPQYRLDQWRKQIEMDAQDMVRDWERGYFSYNFGNACNAYGGCAFRYLCDKDKWQEWWQQKYIVRYWDPLERVDRKPTDTLQDILQGNQ